MAIFDAKVEVTCDGEHCRESIQIQPDFVYRDYSGKSGHYDTRDSAIEEILVSEGWAVEDGKHLCESCKTNQEDEDDKSEIA